MLSTYNSFCAPFGAFALSRVYSEAGAESEATVESEAGADPEMTARLRRATERLRRSSVSKQAAKELRYSYTSSSSTAQGYVAGMDFV